MEIQLPEDKDENENEDDDDDEDDDEHEHEHEFGPTRNPMKSFPSYPRLILFLFLYALTFRSVTLVGGNMQNSIMDMTTAIVERGTTAIDEMHVNSPDVSYYQGHFYSGMSPGISFLAVPFYAAAKVFWRHAPPRLIAIFDRRAENPLDGRKSKYSIFNTPYYKEQIVAHALTTLLFGFGAGLVSFYCVCALAGLLVAGARAAKTIGLAFSLATMMVYYNNVYYTQSVALAFVLLGIFLALVRARGARDLFLGGLCLALGGVVDYPFFIYAALVVVAAAAYQFLQWRGYKNILALGLGFGLVLGPIMIYHARVFGSPFHTAINFRYPASEIGGQFFHRFNLPSLKRVKDLLWSLDEGMLWYSPLCLLFPFGLVECLLRVHRRPAGGARDWRPLILTWLMAALIAASIFHFTRVPWSGAGAAYGPRYILSAVPFMTLFAWPFRKFLRLPFFTLMALWIAIGHLNMIKIPVFTLIHDRWVQGQWAAVPLRVHLFPYSPNGFSLGHGLALDLLYQLIVLGLVFGIPWLLGRRRKTSAAAFQSGS